MNNVDIIIGTVSIIGVLWLWYESDKEQTRRKRLWEEERKRKAVDEVIK